MSSVTPLNIPNKQKPFEKEALDNTSNSNRTEDSYPFMQALQPSETSLFRPSFNTSESDTKSHLLATGYKLLAQKGFTAVGIKLILDTAGIPKGSFYHYFASKEAFGEAVIRGYFDHYKTRLNSISDQNISAQQKLYTYFQYWYDTQQNGCDHEKCLVVKLSGEVADISEPMREALSGGYQQTINWLSEQVQAGWRDGSLPKPDFEPLSQNTEHPTYETRDPETQDSETQDTETQDTEIQDLKTQDSQQHNLNKAETLAAQSVAKRWYYAWLGASLIAKTSQSDAPLQEVWQLTIKDLGFDSK